MQMEWIENETPQVLGRVDPRIGLGAISWKNQVPDERLKTLQSWINTVLVKCDYFGIAVDGILGPQTCGAYAILGDLKNKGCVTEADWQAMPTAVAEEATRNCQSFTYPTKKGETKPDKPTSDLSPEELALPWGRPDPRTAEVQRDLNNDLDGHDYLPISVTGVLDAPTCGAMRLASNKWGMNYLEAFGMNCEAFVDPTPRPADTEPPSVSPEDCREGERFDPATGQCVQITCPGGQVFNPSTNQCETPTSAKRKKRGSPWGLFLLGAGALVAAYFSTV